MAAPDKADAGKAPWHLLPFDALDQVLAVLAFGARKYVANGWEAVPDGHTRYMDAAMRHLRARYGGEILDPESKLPHLACAACSCLFSLAFDLRKKEDN